MSSNETIAQFFPADNEPPVSANGLGYATLDTRNSLQPMNCLDFDAAAPEYARFTGLAPRNYAGGNFNVQLVWSPSSGSTGAVLWLVAPKVMDPNFNVSVSPMTWGTTIAVSASATTAGLFVYTTVSVSVPALVSGRMFSLLIGRDAAAAGDDMTGDAELYSIEVKEL